MVTALPHAQKSGRHTLRRTLAGLATLLVTTGLTTALAGSAHADPATRPTLKAVKALPFAGHGDALGEGDGGRGTVRTNAAVSAACNDGRPISAPQWYSVGKKVRGPLRVVTDATWYPRGVSHEDSGSAVVDHWSGKVLACSGQTVQRWEKPVDVVGYVAEPFTYEYYSLDLTVQINQSASAAPANDLMKNAQPITSLPFSTTLDTSLADGDGPDLLDYSHCLLSAISPTQASTAWYRYTPPKTGLAPVISVSPATGWTSANSDGGWGLRTGILELRADGSTKLMSNASDGDWERCWDPVKLTKGKTYLIGIFYTWDSYQDTILSSGGPVNFSVTAR